MRTSVKVFSWIAIVLGVFAILGSAAEPTPEDAFYAFFGGALFAGFGVVTLIYVDQTDKKLEEKSGN